MKPKHLSISRYLWEQWMYQDGIKYGQSVKQDKQNVSFAELEKAIFDYLMKIPRYRKYSSTVGKQSLRAAKNVQGYESL